MLIVYVDQKPLLAGTTRIPVSAAGSPRSISTLSSHLSSSHRVRLPLSSILSSQ